MLNDCFEYASLQVQNKLILAAFQIELLNLKSAFEFVKDATPEDQFTVAKGLYVC